MQVTGKEKASLEALGNNNYRFTICQLNLDQLLNDFILSQMIYNLKQSNKVKKYFTNYITIGHTKIMNNQKINVKFQASLNECIIEKQTFTAIENDLEVKDFYNCIVDLFEFYAYAQNTDIDNIKLEITEIEILEE